MAERRPAGYPKLKNYKPSKFMLPTSHYDMAFIQYLNFDGENLPLPTSYEVNLEDKEADSGGETEAGTIQRDVVRAGVVEIWLP